MNFLDRMTDVQALVFFVWCIVIWNISWRIIDRRQTRKERKP